MGCRETCLLFCISVTAPSISSWEDVTAGGTWKKNLYIKQTRNRCFDCFTRTFVVLAFCTVIIYDFFFAYSAAFVDFVEKWKVFLSAAAQPLKLNNKKKWPRWCWFWILCPLNNLQLIAFIHPLPFDHKLWIVIVKSQTRQVSLGLQTRS